MTQWNVPTDHERVQVSPGRRTGLPIMIAVHSTVLGPAIGGLRIKPYETGVDGLIDCLRLSQAMTYKAAAVDNGTGGGKAVVPLPSGFELNVTIREAVLLDVADAIESLGGTYLAGPDVGTGPEDMDVLFRRTRWVGGRSKAAGGAGGTTFGTFTGLESAVTAAVDVALGITSFAGLRVTIVGVGGIGALLARALAAKGAVLTLSDVELSKRSMSEELGATWLPPEDALLAPCDVLSPCALGGVFTVGNVERLRCKLICGAANNQLATDDVAGRLRSRDIAYVPDFIASAGGLMFATGVEIHHRTEADAEAHTRGGVARNVRSVLPASKSNGTTTVRAALELGQRRLDAALAHRGRRHGVSVPVCTD